MAGRRRWPSRRHRLGRRRRAGLRQPAHRGDGPGRHRRQRHRGGHDYGDSDDARGQNINLEFVSANPTGPIHIGGTRWAAVGDALGRLLSTQGAEVVREYYFNDHGAQIDRFTNSLIAAAKGEPTPEDGYAGDYIKEIAAQVLAKEPDALSLPDDESARRSAPSAST